MRYLTHIILALTLCLLILLCVIDLTGCEKKQESTITVEAQNSEWDLVRVYKVVDNETGVCYLLVKNGFHSELTPMYNSDGSVKTEAQHDN